MCDESLLSSFGFLLFVLSLSLLFIMLVGLCQFSCGLIDSDRLLDVVGVDLFSSGVTVSFISTCTFCEAILSLSVYWICVFIVVRLLWEKLFGD